MPSSHIVEIRVMGLFGTRDFNLHLDPREPTVLTGGNGSGKSTLLKLVHALCQSDLSRIHDAPILGLEVRFAEEEPVKLSRDAFDQPFTAEWNGESAILDGHEALGAFPSWFSSIIERNNWDYNAVTHDLMLSRADLGLRTIEVDQWRRRFRNMVVNEAQPQRPAWLADLLASKRSAFISDQRLVAQLANTAGDKSPTRLAVESAREEIANLIKEAESEYARNTQRMDRDLPNTLLRAMQSVDPPNTLSTLQLIEDVYARRDQLRQVGLLEQTNVGLKSIPSRALKDEHQRRVIDVIMRTDLMKLDVFEQLRRKLALLAAFLTSHMPGKTVALRRDDGLHFRTENDGLILPKQLSSSEQQLLVIAYEIIFKAPRNSIVIIDEPELSLHVFWQDTLLDDLIEMGRENGVQFLLATHSPTILASHPEFERAIGG